MGNLSRRFGIRGKVSVVASVSKNGKLSQDSIIGMSVGFGINYLLSSTNMHSNGYPQSLCPDIDPLSNV